MNEAVLKTPGGALPLFDYRLSQGGREWTIAHAGVVLTRGDESRVIDGKRDCIPYGVSLWPSAIALAHEIAGRGDISGTKVLELGSGCGLPGIVAASSGARVVQTDHDETSLRLCRSNGERNRVEIEHRLVDWTSWAEPGDYDWIIGADILYVEEMHPHLRRIFASHRGKVLLADPFRKMSVRLLESMESEGWWVTCSTWDVGDLILPRSIGVFELSR